MAATAELKGEKQVALRKESVDRNIVLAVYVAACNFVALRKESVDRNTVGVGELDSSMVALRKESVDRNEGHRIIYNNNPGRSPQGERG